MKKNLCNSLHGYKHPNGLDPCFLCHDVMSSATIFELKDARVNKLKSLSSESSHSCDLELNIGKDDTTPITDGLPCGWLAPLFPTCNRPQVSPLTPHVPSRFSLALGMLNIHHHIRQRILQKDMQRLHCQSTVECGPSEFGRCLSTNQTAPASTTVISWHS